MLWEGSEIKEADVVRRPDIGVILPFLQVVKEPAEIDEGAVVPVCLGTNLQLDVDESLVIEADFDIKDEIFVENFFAQFIWVQDFYGPNFVWFQMKQCADQSFQE